MKQLYIFVIFGLTSVLCDLPTNCSYSQTQGTWVFHIGEMGHTNSVKCQGHIQVKSTLKVELSYPNKVVDEHGNKGTWTMVYNQGFEVEVGGRKYFAFQLSEKTSGKQYRSYCGYTFVGWSHHLVVNNQFPPKNWACYYGVKQDSSASDITLSHPKYGDDYLKVIGSEKYGRHDVYVKALNTVQNKWKATVYDEYEDMSINDLILRSGGRRNLPRVRPSEISPEDLQKVEDLPESFDWRNKSQVNFITPVRNQGKCGSCYAFASMAQIEAGIAIQTDGRIKPVLSTQNIVSCSPYSQGCDGGFPYLIAGMYSQDYGDILEQSYPYIGNTTQCNPLQTKPRMYTAKYGYVGDFYGGCNEALMRYHLIKHGPLSVGIQVSDDFIHYKGGIYEKTKITNPKNLKFNPFEETNHAVLVVGYGVDHDTGTKYWIVKNSWGESWGEDGYFRIVRGKDEIAIESLAVYAVPYFGH